MTTFISVILATLIFGGRMLYLFVRKRRTLDLLPVEAGSTTGADEDFMSPVAVRVGEMPMDASLEYFVVKNDCMAPLHIYPGDVIGVELFNDDFGLNDVKQGDILLIFLDDKKFHGHKIRVMDFVENNTFHTYYFVGDKHQESSEPHGFGTVRGIVREINHPIASVA